MTFKKFEDEKRRVYKYVINIKENRYIMHIILRELDKEKFNQNVIVNLDLEDLYEGCYTNFKSVLIETITEIISEIVEKDGWDLQYFEKDEAEKLFNAFMENSKIIVRLNKKIDELNYDFKEVIIEFYLSESEKKRIAEIYLDNILNEDRYLSKCIFENLEEKDIDIISEFLSDKVYKLLTVDEIKTKFSDKIEKIINEKV